MTLLREGTRDHRFAGGRVVPFPFQAAMSTFPRLKKALQRQGIRVDYQAAWTCVTLREERRIEEAPEAYKPIGPVIDAQEQAGLIRGAVRLKPWITFKA
ncbi:RtcB family protein [Burkholderia ubonensis]|uniref:RtcB family protein n=1 Tax=Burkholderia ubonensis TaxID=101571 RepID=UPI0039F5199A